MKSCLSKIIRFVMCKQIELKVKGENIIMLKYVMLVKLY